MIGDRCEETSNSPGTGTFSLNGAGTGMFGMVAQIGNGNQVYYVASDGGSNVEWGIGTVTDSVPDTLSRDTVLGSSNGGAKVNFSGTITIRCSPVAELLGAIGERLRAATTGGSANAYTLTVRPAPRALVNMMTVRAKASFTVTGAATLNVNATGAKALRKGDGSIALAANDILTSTTFEATYDSGQDVWVVQSPLSSTMFGQTSATDHAVALASGTTGKVTKFLSSLGSSGQFLQSAGAGADPAWATVSAGASAASQAQMEAGSDTATFVCPGRQQLHLTATKIWATVANSGTPAVSASCNVSSVTDNAAGDTTANFSTSFSSAIYAYLGMTRGTTDNNIQAAQVSFATDPTASAFRLVTIGEGNSAPTDTNFSVGFLGDF